MKLSKNLFPKREQDERKTMSFHAKPELVQLIKKEYKLAKADPKQDVKSLSTFISVILMDVLSQMDEARKKKAG